MSDKTQYAPAPEVAEVAARLIERFHPHLRGVRIEYVFLSKPPRQSGRVLAGRARKVTGLNAYLATPGSSGEPQPFFVIEIVAPIWDAWPGAKRLALVNHELKHCGRNVETGALSIIPHDVEEFHDIALWHGAWDEDLELLAEALSQADGRLTDTTFAGVSYGTQREAEEPLARIDLRRSQDARDQQARGQV
jgi:hypothetical protein